MSLLKIGNIGFGNTRCSLCLNPLYGLPETSTDGCSILGKKDIGLTILLYFEEAIIETNSILCNKILSNS